VKIYTLIALSVFACVCFTGGFVLGQNTYYDEKSLDLLKQGYMDYLNDASELQKLGSDLVLINLLTECEKEDCSKIIDEAIKPQLKEVVDKYDSGGFKGFQRIMMQSDIEKAKKHLKIET